MYVDYQLTRVPKDCPGTGRPDKNGFIRLEMGGGLAKLNPETGELKVFRLDDPTRPFIHEVFPTADGSSVWLTVQDQYEGPRPRQTNTIAPWPQFRNNDTETIGSAPRTHTAVADPAGNIWASGRPLKKFDIETKK